VTHTRGTRHADLRFYGMFRESAAYVRTNPFIPQGPIMLSKGVLTVVGMRPVNLPSANNDNEAQASQ
jgi:hypothetical protein